MQQLTELLKVPLSNVQWAELKQLGRDSADLLTCYLLGSTRIFVRFPKLQAKNIQPGKEGYLRSRSTIHLFGEYPMRVAMNGPLFRYSKRPQLQRHANNEDQKCVLSCGIKSWLRLITKRERERKSNRVISCSLSFSVSLSLSCCHQLFAIRNWFQIHSRTTVQWNVLLIAV